MKAVIEYVLEVSDHDGYCSGEECDYKQESKMYIIDVPDDLKDVPEGVYENPARYDWTPYLPRPKINQFGSGYCHISTKAQYARLERHDYRFNIIRVEFVEEQYVEDLIYQQENQ